MRKTRRRTKRSLLDSLAGCHSFTLRFEGPLVANRGEGSDADELLDAYLFVEDADALYAEYAAQGVEFIRGLGNMPWHCREFVVKDCDGRLLAFGANLQKLLENIPSVPNGPMAQQLTYMLIDLFHASSSIVCSQFVGVNPCSETKN